MFINTSKTQIILSIFIAILSFLQAINHWGEKVLLSWFFALMSILLLIMAIISVIINIRKSRKIKS